MRRLLAIVLLLLPGAPTRADFHFFELSEVYTDATGSVQFIELFTSVAGQQFLEGHAVRTLAAGAELQAFVFPADLPGDTRNRHCLLATPGFAAVAGIAPDYEIPPAFVEAGVADAIDFASVDSLSLAGLPTDGTLALHANGAPAEPTPTNFAGAVGTIELPEPAASCRGLAVAGVLAALAVWQGRRALRGGDG